MVNFIVLLEIWGIFIIITAMLMMLSGDGAREQKLMEYFLCGSLIQNVGYVLEWTAPTLEAGVMAVKMEYVGSTFIPLLYCWFLYSYCYEKPPKKLLMGIAVVNFIMLFFVLSCDHHPYFYRSVGWMETETGHGYLWLEYGSLYPLFLANWMIIPYLLSLSVLIRAVVKHSNHTDNRQYKAILIVSVFPIVGYCAYAFKLIQVFDPTPLILGLGLSLVAILIWSRRNYDFHHLAADVVLASMADGVIALDERRRLVSYNQIAAEIFPKLSSHRAGEGIEDLEGFREDMLDEGVARTLELGDRYYESHAKQITTKDGKCQGYVILVLDMTDTQNYIDEIKEVRRQAEQANIAKSEFLANMSHEIRTPMNAIIGLSDIILEESRGRKVYAYARDVQSAAKNLLAIINDILDLSKVEAGKMELVMSDYYIKSVVGEIVGMMDMAASQRGLLMKYEYDMNIPCQYRGDEGRIKQILINLLNNAIKFTKDGYVKIFIGGRPGNFENEEFVIFRVEDTGCGIRKEDQEKIFEDFKQVDSKKNRSVEGTGLGLSITRHLVELMHGTIQLESVYGKGSVFTVVIPQQIVDAHTLAESPDTPEQAVEQTDDFIAPDVKVLIVDDNTINRKVARGFLKIYGFELSEAASGPEAIELVKQTKFDIIFMDHMMPEMDGIEAVEHIRQDCGENGTSPVVVALTANAMQGIRERFLNCGFQDFIAKPLGRRPLNELLKRWIPEERRKAKTAGDQLQKKENGVEKFRINGIDTATAAMYGSDNEEGYQELLELYCMEGERKTERLKKLVKSGDIKNYEVEVHGLKSASANIGALELSDMAKEQEMAAHRGDYEEIEQGFWLFLEAYEEQVENIRQFLDGQKQAVSGTEEEMQDIDMESFIEKMEEALERLQSFRSRECAEKIQALFVYRMEEDTAVKLKEIQNQLKMYEDDAAEELLLQLLRELRMNA